MYTSINKGYFVPIYTSTKEMMWNTYGCGEPFGLLTGSGKAVLPFSFRVPKLSTFTVNANIRLHNSSGGTAASISQSKFLFHNIGNKTMITYLGGDLLEEDVCGLYYISIRIGFNSYYTEMFDMRELKGNFFSLQMWDDTDTEIFPYSLGLKHKVYFEGYPIDVSSEENYEVSVNGYNEEEVDFMDIKERSGIDMVNFPDYWKFPFDAVGTFDNIKLYDYMNSKTTDLKFARCTDRKQGDCLSTGTLTWQSAHLVKKCDTGPYSYTPFSGE